MKINISRQTIYLLSLSVLLFLFVVFFSFLVLVPEGKNYRKDSIELKKETVELNRYQDFYDETLELLKKRQSDHRTIITAFEKEFNPKRFVKQNNRYFNSLSVSEKFGSSKDDGFIAYEVNTTSKISSPKSFYAFLDGLNKSDWIIGIDFPINFKREGEMIKSMFTMKVYCVQKEDDNTSMTDANVKQESNLTKI